MQANFATNFVSFFEGKKQLMSLWHLKERYCHGLKEFYEMVIKCFIFWWNKGSLVFELAWLKAMYMVYCPLVSETLASLICEHQYHYKDKTLLVYVKKIHFSSNWWQRHLWSDFFGREGYYALGIKAAMHYIHVPLSKFQTPLVVYWCTVQA